MKITHGTCRLVILTKNYAYKLPIGLRGIKANRSEYKNFLNCQHLVAKTEKRWWGLKQERLYNTVCYKQGTTKQELAEEHQELYDFKLTNRIQIGQDKFGVWKFFDYEDVKFYNN